MPAALKNSTGTTSLNISFSRVVYLLAGSFSTWRVTHRKLTWVSRVTCEEKDSKGRCSQNCASRSHCCPPQVVNNTYASYCSLQELKINACSLRAIAVSISKHQAAHGQAFVSLWAVVQRVQAAVNPES